MGAVIELLGPYKGLLKVAKVCTDNTVFRLHYRFTVPLLFMCSMLVTGGQLFGDPIHCVGNNDQIYKEAANSFCWIYGTYTVRTRLDGVAGQNYAQVGVGPSKGTQDEIVHAYYQWVCVVLLLQAGMFYAPRHFWKLWENGRLKALTEQLNEPIVSSAWTERRKTELVAYLTNSNLYAHNMYAARFALCEILNLANVIFQIFFLNMFLGGSFLTYGAAVAAFNRVPDSAADLQTADPMSRYFPKVTKCLFRYFGPSGDIQTKDLLCILPINMVNEKIFIVLWFWLFFLALASVLMIVQRILVFTCPGLRTLFLMSQLRYVKWQHVRCVVKNTHFGDWFMLHQLGKNLHPSIFKELIVELSNRLDCDHIM